MMPVKVEVYEQLLQASNYIESEIEFLIDGFKNGFSLESKIQVEGIRWTAPNLRLNVGNETILWNKVMKEVQAKNVAGPFEEVLYKWLIQSPIGQVPKDGGKATRLIFH